jgi:hypothetical protein
MSLCKSSAFLDKHDKFYLNYKYSANYSEREKGSGTDDGNCYGDPLPSYESTFAIELKILPGKNPLYNGSYSFSNRASCCGEECCSEDGHSTQWRNIDTTIKNNLFKTVDTFSPAHKSDGSCGQKYTDNSNGLYVGTLGIIDGSFCPCGYCEDTDEEYPGYAGSIQKYRKQTGGGGSIIFGREVKLYNSNGEEIINPWSIIPYPEPYDACTKPIRSVLAPGCHFFHE